MGELIEDHTGDADMNNCETVFDNLTIFKEFNNIVNLVRTEDFLETVPKAKLKRVKWAPMFNCLKQGLLDEIVQEVSCMWKYENMHHKLQVLEKQKEKLGDLNTDTTLWRPQLADVKAQLKAHDVANLQKQKVLLESLAKEHEKRVNRLKKNVSAKQGYIKALQMDILKYQKKNEDIILRVYDKFENHKNLIEMMVQTEEDVENIKWNDTDWEHNK